MAGTKNKILIASLQLFNDLGISNVSLRTIAEQMGISVGNLQYHFKKREDIVEELYFQLVEEMDRLYQIEGDDLLSIVVGRASKVCATLYDYRFFLLDFVSITRKNQKIKSHYAELSKRREMETLHIAEMLISNGILRKEEVKNEYQSLFKRIEVITNFWFSSLLIQRESLSPLAIEEYTKLISHSIYSYLTEEAKEQYKLSFPKQVL